jgi:hypothetical protein
MGRVQIQLLHASFGEYVFSSSLYAVYKLPCLYSSTFVNACHVDVVSSLDLDELCILDICILDAMGVRPLDSKHTYA